MSGDALPGAVPSWLKIAAILISLAGLADSAYLTSKHFAGTSVPCNLVTGCETVLTSTYSEFLGIPTALFGVVAYFTAFSLVLLAYFGREKLWLLFGALAVVMLLFSVWFVYLQAFVIKAYCQYCLVSAVTSTLLFLIFAASFPLRKR